jgi:hypothetical protein
MEREARENAKRGVQKRKSVEGDKRERRKRRNLRKERTGGQEGEEGVEAKKKIPYNYPKHRIPFIAFGLNDLKPENPTDRLVRLLV